MGLIGGGIIWTTAAPMHGRLWTDVAGPFFVVGAGTAFAFIPVSIAALAGIAEREAGLASGLLNTSQQIGGAIGVAIASTVAATHFKTLIHSGSAAPAALTGGFQWAFWVCGAIALAAIPITFLLVRSRDLSPAATMQPALSTESTQRKAA
jgi:MFS family permease